MSRGEEAPGSGRHSGRPPLRIAVAQPVTRSYDLTANVAQHAAAVRLAAADVVVFPEMSLTGYELDAPAVPIDAPALAPLIEACAATATTALVGAPISESPGVDHIAVLAVDGLGVTVAYRKMWPGTEEALRFAAGSRPAALQVAGWRLGLAVCRDTGIPEHQRRTYQLGIDAYVAGTVMFPDERGEQDRRGSTIAASLGIPVALASFAGSTGAGYHSTAGCSAIWSATGEVLHQLGSAADLVATVVLR